MISRGLTIIAGPTASGKSSFAMALAKKTGGTIVCADSLQLFRDLPILTAAPTDADKKEIPHVLFGVLQAGDEASVGVYLSLLKPVLEAVENPILVGGTGMYLKAVKDGITVFPDIPAKIREEVRGKNLEDIRKALPGFKFTDPQRLRRAYEVYLATGKRIEDFQNGEKEKIFTGLIRSVLIDPPKDVLEERIRLRLKQMLKGGVLEEVRAFSGDSIAIGLSEIRAFLRGDLSEKEMVEEIVIKTRQYAKRQRTWFRHQMVFDEVVSGT